MSERTQGLRWAMSSTIIGDQLYVEKGLPQEPNEASMFRAVCPKMLPVYGDHRLPAHDYVLGGAALGTDEVVWHHDLFIAASCSANWFVSARAYSSVLYSSMLCKPA